ncbi:MAG: protein-glutamate O-methyltransferase CheR [Mailhella sp.]|nr:protein-glutamate O-methyltransferase CheR [Mailhella sp.]
MAAKTADTQQTQADKTPPASPFKKSNVNIPFDISKLTLEEKLAVLEKINADIENETKNKRVLQPTPARTAAPAQSVSQARPTATQLFKSAQPQATDGGSSLFAKRNAAQDSAALANNASAIRSPLARRAAGEDSSGNEIKITNDEFVTLRDFLYDQCGIFVGENRKYLMENRLNARLRELGLHSFSEYHNYLRYDKNKTAELNELFINMTTNETSFFRNNVQLDIFRDKVLAKLISEQRAKGEKKINIWSAGCSSGEEPYTIAIILLDLLKGEINDWNIKITANDLSLAMLNIARKGVYSEYALRTTPPEIVEKYFIKEGRNYKIVPAAQKLVQFGQINLSRADQLARVERSHIVFCRNVIIYFDDAMKKHVINAFYDNLLPGGYLLIGHSESLHNISRTFKPEHHPGAIIYRKQS